MINDVRFHKHSYTAFFETIHMMMTIDRPTLLNRLIQAKSHHLIKIITGIRRCGESYLLFRLFKDHLLSSGINPRNIIEINLEHPDFHAFRNALALRDLIDKRMKAIRGECFILIDEIQLARKILPPDIDLAYAIPSEDKFTQETNSLRHLHDGFRRIVINADLYGSPHMDDNGITFMRLKPFLLDPKSIETL